MTSYEETIQRVLVRTVPLPAGTGRDWEDVLYRSAASTRTARTRRLVYSVAFAAVVAIVLAATPLGAMIARGFGDFSGWLSGKPGKTASSTEQQAFAQEYRRSWVRFPKTPSLRSLISVSRDGVHYELLGYRTGDSFCLRLVASSTSTSTYTSCAPKSDLVARRTPVLPLEIDASITRREREGRRIVFIKLAAVTFGITSDGVAAIRARTQSHDLEGIVGSDSFLIVNPLAEAGARIRSIIASDASGDELAIPFVRRIEEIPVAPFGATIARGFGDFSGWLSGSAGHPVSTSKQQAFARENRRSWVRFPKTPNLRSLISASRDGVHYELLGYRTGVSFCLRLVASSTSTSTYTSCAPKSDLVARRTPVLPLAVDVPILGRVKTRWRNIFIERGAVTFGITSDGVAAVRARTQSHDLNGIVGGDSFLIVNPRSAAGARIRSIIASDASGDELAIPFVRPFEEIPGALNGKLQAPTGPAKAERPVEHVRIGWLARRELRGTAFPLSRLRSIFQQAQRRATFARLLTPAPGGVERVLVSLDRGGGLCVGLVSTPRGSAISCQPLKMLSANWPWPFVWGEGGGPGGNQYETIVGLADDEVARMALFLATGERVAVPLKDNAFVVEAASSKYPYRLVAYDSAGRTIGVYAVQNHGTYLSALRPSFPPERAATGSTKVERPIKHVRIGWFARHELRGTAVPPGIIRFRKSTFRRLLAPDPGGVARVLVYVDRNDELCFGLVLGRGWGVGCAPLKQVSNNFPLPFTLGSGGGGSSQYTSVFGLADDEVARMTLFLATGERVAVPLKDNAFVVEAASSKYPFRLVAYDSEGRVVGLSTIHDDPLFPHSG
jgi:hypothetical protein